MMEKRHIGKLIIGLILAGSLIVLLCILQDVWVPLFLALFLAYLLYPLMLRFEKKMTRRGALFSCFAVLLMIVGGIVLLIPAIFNELRDVLFRLPLYIDMLNEWIENFEKTLLSNGVPQEVITSLKERFGNWQEGLADRVEIFMAGLMRNLGKLTWVGIVPFLTFYFLKDREYFSTMVFRLIPQPYRLSVRRLGGEISKALQQYIRGQVLVAIFVGVLTGLGLYLAGIPYAILLGIFMAFTEFIPYIGPYIGGIPVLVSAALIGPEKIIIALMIVFAIQQVESLYLSPKLLGKSTRLHPVYIVLVLLIGESLGGIFGMVLAIPLALIIRILAKTLYNYFLQNGTFLQKN